MNRRLRRLDGPQPDCPYALLRVAALPRLRRGARAARSGRDGARFTHSCCHAKSGLQEWGGMRLALQRHAWFAQFGATPRTLGGRF